MRETVQAESGAAPAVAVVGMAGRFPGAADVEAFWRNLREGVHGITFFDPEELEAAGVDPAVARDPAYVPAFGVLEGIDRFDAAFFGFSPREAEVLDPQHRLFLETAWEALESAGYDPRRIREAVGVYAGSAASHYAANVFSNPAVVEAVGAFQVTLANGQDFLATRAAHRLNLCGPALNVQTACSTGLVAVHVACQALASGECDLALAGGVSVRTEQRGYMYQPGGIASPDGFCRSFDADAAGTVVGSGVGIVVLKRLEDALADGDTIRAVVRGSAINNDGEEKAGFTAPSVDGQAAVIEEALAVAGVDPASVGYVEAHGSGTELGDPVEFSALVQAFGEGLPAASCGLGSVKTNVGHLDAAAGATGFIKAALAVGHGEIPPSLHFTTPNPRIDLAASPFFVPTSLRPWPEGRGPRRAGVSSFGIGGTNAHVVLEEPPAPEPSTPARDWHLLTLSARTPEALDAATDRLAAHLRTHPDAQLADVAYTLQVGRRAFEHRRVAVVRGGDAAGAAETLATRAADRVAAGIAPERARPVTFLFPGLGSHYPGMGRGLYETEPVYREVVDRCAEILRPLVGRDIREVLFPGGEEESRPLRADDPGEGVDRTGLAHPALFVTQYALARLWMHWGVRPAAMMGHGLGEYAAAAVAEVWTLEDALALAAERARLIEALPPGGMMGLPLPPEEAIPLMGPELAVGAINARTITVSSGPAGVLDALQARLSAEGMFVRRLPLRRAFHSPIMEPVAERLARMMSGMRLSPPRIPFVSNVTGTWIRAAEATDPGYWARHLAGTVRFSEGVETLAGEGQRLFVEVGPGHGLRMLTTQLDVWEERAPIVVGSLRHGYERRDDVAHFLEAAGRLWAAGGEVDWDAVHDHERLRRVPLPTYPFERRRYWLERRELAAVPVADPMARRDDPATWLHLPTWTRAPLPAPSEAPAPESWLVLADDAGVGARLAARLEAEGHAVAMARPGTEFARTGEGRYTLRPGVAEDLAALRAAGVRPDAVAHLWGVDGADAGEADPFLHAHLRGAATVAALAATFGGEGEGLRLFVVTDGVMDVTGSEGVRPERATVLGPVLTLPHEHPSLRCRTVDVRLAPGGEARLAAALHAEVVSPGGDRAVALRGALRWVRAFQPLPPAAGGAGLRPGGSYAFCGPLPPESRMVASRLLAEGARVAVVLEPGAADPEIPGARVLRAPATDPVSLRGALEEARAAAGALHGVVHAVGLGRVGLPTLLVDARPVEDAADLARASRELDVLREATEGMELDFCLLQNSIFTVLGAPALWGTTAGCALVDAHAERAAAAGAPWVSVSWDRWKLDGAEGGGARTSAGERAILPEEGMRAFGLAAARAGEPRIVVSTHDLDARLAHLREGAARAAAPAAAGGGATEGAPAAAARHPRPALGTAYHPPSDPTEEILAGIWSDLTGIDGIGVHDDFFQLGGHSLLGLQVLARVSSAFQVQLPLQAIFEAPTVARLAALVEEAILMELDEMSEEEALERLGEPVG